MIAIATITSTTSAARAYSRYLSAFMHDIRGCREAGVGPQPGTDLERAMGIEPTPEAWEAAVLPLNYARGSADSTIVSPFLP